MLRFLNRAVAVAMLAAAPAFAQQQWRLAESVRIGGETEMTIFSDVRGLVAGPTGNIFVLDFKVQEIRMFDSAGKFVKLVARRGQGPGELANANGLLLTPDGTVWANDPSNNRWSAYSAIDGRYLRQVALPIRMYSYIWNGSVDAKGRIVDPISVRSTENDAQGRPTSLAKLRRVNVGAEAVRSANDTSIVGPPADTLSPVGCSTRVRAKYMSWAGYDANGRAMGYTSVPFQPRMLSAYGPGGDVWCAPGDEYFIIHRTLERPDTLHTIRATFAPLPVTEKQRAAAIADAHKFLDKYARTDADYSVMPAVQPMIDRIDVDREGRLWVHRTSSDTTKTTWEIYDSAAKRVATVAAPFRVGSYLPMFITKDALYAVVTDDDGVPVIIRARISILPG